jgi:hypothetical protein
VLCGLAVVDESRNRQCRREEPTPAWHSYHSNWQLASLVRFAKRIGRRELEQAGQFVRANQLAVLTEKTLFTVRN